MSPSLLKGSLILLVITSIAIIWHSIDQESLRGAPLSGATKQSPANKGLTEIASLPLVARNDHKTLLPEQRFLINGPVDVNRATIEDLEAIPRIGPSLAKKITDWRDKKGHIGSLEELLEVNGIGRRILATIKPYLRTD